ncbi:MAG TPA: glycosyltransferase, partial [Bdellovibrionales bacterium]|nr:glycosyltransferase [Bdellovibrionales bacterium]
LRALRCVHERSAPTAAQERVWLVVDDLRAGLDLPEHATCLWLPRPDDPHADGILRAWPRARADRLFLHWPHERAVKPLRWKWRHLLETQENWSRSFPYLRMHPIPGWDLHNPDVADDLDMEPMPDMIWDRRLGVSPQVSIVIPTYNNLRPLRSTVETWLNTQSSTPVELIVADDGSDDGTAEWFRELSKREVGTSWLYLRIPRPRPRRMGRGGFRAGIARNVAATHARAPLLLFLDSDILAPRRYADELVRLHEIHDVIQATRLQLRFVAPETPKPFAEIHAGDIDVDANVWTTFQNLKQPWNEMDDKWKFASTFCLSVKREHFFKLGRFRRSFHKYGFEDTDLGYRADRAGLKFHRSSTAVYHFRHDRGRSEYRHRPRLKQKLLRDSARVFYLNNPEPRLQHVLSQYLRPGGRWYSPWS